MANSFAIRLITPQGKLLEGQARYASVPAHDGLIGFQPGRAPIVFKLGLGEMRVDFAEDGRGSNAGGGTRAFLVEDGFAQMVNNKLTVLTTRAIAADELSESEAQAELRAAEGKTGKTPQEVQAATRDRDRARVKIALARAYAGKGV